ncbi:hypothetical protein ACFVY4_26840 [Streptomyces sp. NPDC058299]|uniref:hypothetical protein n=1 Tax=Streptomyces sp. NPDC058299 TaxID=3346435 RepID=UPI0036DFFBA9
MSGRGQPPKIGPERYGELLGLLASGLSLPAAAARMNVSRATLYNLAGRVPSMGEAMGRARVVGRRAKEAARKAAHEPSESCYVNHGCRTPECTRAATEARAQRRAPASSPVTTLPALGGEVVTVYQLLADGPTPLADSA